MSGPFVRSISHPNDRTPGRRLRIGYVSPISAAIAPIFLLPLLAHHDRERVEVFCCSGVTQPDAVTASFQALGHTWRESRHLSDVQLAAQIQADRIDILVDLTLHTAGNRMLVFARKPGAGAGHLARLPSTPA